MLDELATDKPEDYRAFWREFGVALKEGLHFETEHKDRIAKLVRWESTAGADLVSLDEYVDRMKVDQLAIYYATGTSRSVLSSSPHLEALKDRGFEVLLMTDAVDSFAVSALETYRDKDLVSAMTADLDLKGKSDAESGDEQKKDPEGTTSGALFTRFREVLGARVEGVRPSGRLRSSPACLVTPTGGLQPHLERLLRAQKLEVPISKRILEVNATHPVIAMIGALFERDPASPKVTEWMEIVYDQALISEGSPIEDPGAFAERLTALLQDAATAALGARSESPDAGSGP
jgi:molecular chaperone HtpG